MSPLSALLWRSVPIEAIAWREWDGEFVVRNERSGSSHLLAALAGRVLQALLDADRPLSSDEIRARVDPEATERRSISVAEIDAVLAEFGRLGLAEQEPA